MFDVRSLLGKRSTSSHPIGSPTASGSLPDAEDVPAAPAAKVAANPGLEERFESLVLTVADLSSRLAVVPDLQRQISKLRLELDNERLANQELKQELAACKASEFRSDDRYIKLEKRVDAQEKGKRPATYADAVGHDEADRLRRKQDEITGDVVQLQQMVEHQERQSRLQNVMFFGLADDGQRSPAQQVIDCLQAAGVPESNKVVRAVRLGARRSSASAPGPSRPAPVKVVMQSATDASLLLRHTRALRERYHVNLDRDLTPAQADIRRGKQGAARELRNRGFVTFWRGDQLMYVNKATGQRDVFTGSMPSCA